MANGPLRNLEKARAALVAKRLELRRARTALVNARRNWAKALAGPYQRGKSDHEIKDITDIQHAIDAIDRAILDEGNGK